MSCLFALFNDQKLSICEYDKKTHGNDIYCKCCNEKILAKKGPIKIHHYSHKSNTNCSFNKKEHKTEWHMFWQNSIKDENLEIIITKNDVKHIADIKNNNDLIIEIQHSNIKLEDVYERETFYENMIWILDGNNIEDNNNKQISQCVDVAFEFTQNAKTYYMIKSTKKFWLYMSKPKYIDTHYGIIKIIKLYDKGYYLCEHVSIEKFLQMYFVNIFKSNNNTFITKYNESKTTQLDNFNNYEIKNKVMTLKLKTENHNKYYPIKYDMETDTFNNISKHHEIELLYLLGYVQKNKYTFAGNNFRQISYLKCDKCTNTCVFHYTVANIAHFSTRNMIDLTNNIGFTYDKVKYCYNCFINYISSFNDKCIYKLCIDGDTVIIQPTEYKCSICDNLTHTLKLFDEYKINDELINCDNYCVDVCYQHKGLNYCWLCFEEDSNPSNNKKEYKFIKNNNQYIWQLIKVISNCTDCNTEIQYKKSDVFHRFCIEQTTIPYQPINYFVYIDGDREYCSKCFMKKYYPIDQNCIYDTKYILARNPNYNYLIWFKDPISNQSLKSAKCIKNIKDSIANNIIIEKEIPKIINKKDLMSNTNDFFRMSITKKELESMNIKKKTNTKKR